MKVDLVFRSEFRISGLTTVRRFITNGLFDPDPLIGGSYPQSFLEWSNFYSFNRVIAYDITLHVSNIEVYPVTLNLCHLNTDPGLSPTNYPSYSQQAYGFVTQLGPATGMSNMKYAKKLTPRHVVGDVMTRTSERYVGSAAANPADTTYFGIQVQDNTGALPNGVSFIYVCKFTAEFFDRRNVVLSAAAESKSEPLPTLVSVRKEVPPPKQ